MDFDTAKENIQPLASGRNAEQLETALIAESDHEIQQKLNEQRKEFEKAIETYEGDDPLQPWYEYIEWIEQIYPKSGKESALNEMLSKCLALFEKDERYFQDRRMLKLYIKYIDSEPNPPQFYEQLYNNGIGTMIADLYLCWAYYYDYCDNFEKAENVYRKGLDARAQPIELIEQAHKQFGFSMSQRILYKDESTQREFRSSMDEQRLALTSLRAHKHRHVGSIRTGSAVKSHKPGRLDQLSSSNQLSNRKVQIFEDAGAGPTSPTASTSVVQTILNSTKKQENLREPGPWTKAKMKSKALFSGASSSKPSFHILEDLPQIPLADSENHYARGIQLPDDFVSRNLPQEEFSFQLHRDEEPAKNTIYKYDKFMVFPSPNKCYSLEELFAYKWFKSHDIENDFTREQDKTWETGYGIPIRLPPHFVRKNAKQDDYPQNPINFDEALANGQRKFGFNINLIYTPDDEFSPEEILQSKWIHGELISQKDAEMEITCGFERREEIYNRNSKRRSMALGGRKSILPRKSDSPRKSICARRSLAPPTSKIADSQEASSSSHAEITSDAIKRQSLPKRKSVYAPLDALTTIPETASPPVLRRKLNEDEETLENYSRPNPSKFDIFVDGEPKEIESDENVFKIPQSAPKSQVSSGFQDEELDGCTTQSFNFFIKSQSISTPKVTKPHAKLAETDGATSMRKELDFGSDTEPLPAENQNTETVKQPFACRSTDTESPYVICEPHEVYRQKLSAIMETTEECATVSSLAATTSSKSSSAEDFDFTKHTTNQQSSVAMSTNRYHTIINNTAKMSTSNVSVANRENEPKKTSCIDFEIYQEETTQKPDNSISKQVPISVIKYVELAQSSNLQTEPDGFDKTLPPAGQFHIYEDELKPDGLEMQQNSKKSYSLLAKEIDNLKDDPEYGEKSVFEISQSDTAQSKWSSKTLTNKNASIVHNTTTGASMQEQKEKMALTAAGVLPQIPTKTGFQVQREDTGLTLQPINFIEERTEQIPAFPSSNQTNFTQTMPQMYEHEKIEAPSAFVPDIPEDDATKILESKMFKTNTSKVDATKAIDQSTYNKSVFVFPQEDTTTNAFSTNLNEERTETIPKLPNLMEMSYMGCENVSSFPLPEMPTLPPEINFGSETLKNMSQTTDQIKADITLKNGDKSNALAKSTFHVDLDFNQSKTIGNIFSQKSFIDSNTNDLRKIVEGPTTDAPADKNKSIFALEHEKGSEQTMNFMGNQSKNITNEYLVDKLSTMIDAPEEATKEIHSSIPVTEKSSFLLKTMTMGQQLSKSKTKIDDEFYATINHGHASPEIEIEKCDGNQSIFSRSKPTIDDEFYAMIKSPIRKLTERSLANTIVIVDTPPSPAAPNPIRKSTAPERMTLAHQILQLRDPSMSLLEPMRRVSVQESSAQYTETILSADQRNESAEPKAFSEENPNTAMFSLHMPSIKNSTILATSRETLHNITDELKTSAVCSNEKSMSTIQGSQKRQNDEKPLIQGITQMNLCEAFIASNIKPELKDDSVHIKEEPLNITTDAGFEKTASNIDDELYECIIDKDNNTNGFLDLSIQLTETEMANMESKTETVVKQNQNVVTNFMICNPVSIRPSQFPMNETKFNDDSTIKHDTKQEDASLIVVEDTEDMSSICKSTSAANKSRRETLQSSFNNRYATNPKLNETISAVKEIDPFEMHLQNALLDDIDFIEYIKSLEYVHILTRVRAMEVGTSLAIGDETFDVLKKVGQGSFGFVYSGKSTKSGKMYAFKQERPANLWEFYISLEIATRVEDANILPGFMSVGYAMIGHNSSIFGTEFCDYGSLVDVCNRHKLNTCRNIDEIIAMIFSEQMLSIIDHLHASNIIHGDIKPDNFLLLKKLNYGTNELVIKLIDYGRSIDLNFFPPNQTFTSTMNTKHFICTEMLENRPWKHQIDLFCLASTMYSLICGKYMNVKKQPDSKIRPYTLTEDLPSYVDVQLWEHILYSLINVRDHNSLPDLQKLRLRIREAIVDNEHNSKISKFNEILDS